MMKAKGLAKNKLNKKNKNKKKYIFSWDEYWHVEKLEFKKNMVLEIRLVGKKVDSIPVDLFVGKVNLGQSYPIVKDNSKKVIVRFYQPLAFQRLDESFAFEKGGVFTGERLRIYTESEYLRYFSKISFGIVDLPIKHHCIIGSDDIVDVLSIDDPEIEIVK